MNRLAACLILGLAAGPAWAESPAAPDGSTEDGFSLIEEGAKIILRSLLDDVEPKMEDLQKGLGEALEAMKPALGDLLARIDDFRNYHPPEILPNGDIIIRRKTPAEIAAPQPGGEIEL